MARKRRRWKQLEMFEQRWTTMSQIRSPMDTLTEVDAVEVCADGMLDEAAAREGMTRFSGEPDDVFRERVQNAIRVRRAAKRVERGESLIPQSGVGAASKGS